MAEWKWVSCISGQDFFSSSFNLILLQFLNYELNGLHWKYNKLNWNSKIFFSSPFNLILLQFLPPLIMSWMGYIENTIKYNKLNWNSKIFFSSPFNLILLQFLNYELNGLHWKYNKLNWNSKIFFLPPSILSFFNFCHTCNKRIQICIMHNVEIYIYVLSMN
jgi:transposase